MTAVQVKVQLTTSELLEATNQLNTHELGEFVEQITHLYAHRKAPSLSPKETELLLKINQGIPATTQKPYTRLRKRLEAEEITPEEQEELIRLSDQIESQNVERLQALIELAQLRNMSVKEMMKQLGISSPDYE